MKTNLQRMLIAIAGLLISANAFAYDFKKDGIYYNILSETDRTVAVTYNYNYFSGNLIIPAKVIYIGKTYTVTSIGNGAFSDCSGLTSVEIPNSVTSIGNSAFWKCSGLTEVTIGNSVTSIGANAFCSCDGLTKVTIGDSVTSIGNSAFSYCSGLTEVTIGNSVTSIGDYAFSDCSGLTSVTFNAENCTVMGDSDYPVFKNCSILKTLTIGEKVKNIPPSAFYNCSGLTSVIIPNSVTSIGDYAFYNCNGLTSIIIPNSVTSIGDYAFCNCNGLTSVIIPNSVTSIGDYAFYNCNGLTSIVVEDGNTKYDSQNNCNAIIETSTNTLIVGCKNTTIPNSVTSIGDHAFFGCSGLTSVEIPNSVTSIGSGAFKSCSNIRSIYCQSTTPPTYNNGFDDDVLMYSTLYVPTGCKSAYEAVDPWRNFWNIEEMEFNGIEDIIADSNEISVMAQDGEIVVNGIENAMVEVCNIGGQLVYSGDDTTISVADKGIYIVKVSGKTFKIAL